MVRGDFDLIAADLLAPAAEHRKAAVPGDRIEPRFDVQVTLAVALDVCVRGNEGVLNGVLGVRGRSEHVAAEAENPCRVAVVEDLEGRDLASADVLDQALVGERSEESTWPGHADGMRPWRGNCF